MAAVIIQVNPRFYTNYSSNSLFVSANTYQKNSTKEYCIARHDDKMCFLPSCRYHIKQISEIKELLQNWMHSLSTTNTWTVCINFSCTDSMAIMLARVEECLKMCWGEFISTSNTGVDRMPSVLKKRLLRKNAEKNCWLHSKRPNWRKLVDKSLQTELNKLKRLKLN